MAEIRADGIESSDLGELWCNRQHNVPYITILAFTLILLNNKAVLQFINFIHGDFCVS